MEKVTKWNDAGFVVSSSYRSKILSLLDKPKTPSTLSKESGINKTHVSRALAELEDKKMILCLTPDNKRGRIYSITKYGRDILEKIPEL